MKKFSLLIALALLGSTIAFSPVNAQDDQQAFERTWYATCYQEKNVDKCYQQSKELIQKYPSSTYVEAAKKNVFTVDLNKAVERFQAALKAYYSGPDANKLDQLFAAGEEYLRLQPGNQYVVGQMALAGAHGSLGQIYKNYDKVKGYGEQALKLFEAAKVPEGWEQASWDSLRELVMAQINQFLGYRLIETKGDKAQAIDYLTRSTQVKSDEGAGWKDPNNYWLRASLYSEEYQALRAEYDKLTDDEKRGDPGKELLKKVNEVVDNKLIPDYARVMATASKPEAKSLKDAAKQVFDSYWDYRTKAPEKAQDYLKAFNADPTVAAPAIPVRTEESDPASLQAPTGPTNAKLVSAPSGAPGEKTTTNGKSSKSTKAAPKGRPTKRKKP